MVISTTSTSTLPIRWLSVILISAGASILEIGFSLVWTTGREPLDFTEASGFSFF